MTEPIDTLPSRRLEVPIEEVVVWRRALHQNPELSFREYQTADMIEELLTEWDIPTYRLTPTSVIGVIEGSAGDPATGRVVGFRADIDALPIQEETGLEYASRNPGVMHACGHDLHTAMLLGTAKVLSGMRERLHGKVMLIFQHAEEMLPGGARELVEKGAADDLDEVYAFHVAPHPVGHVGICRGRVSTMSGIVSVSIRGRGGHSSNPQLAIDPVLIAAEVTMMLNTIVSRDLDPKHMNIVNVGSLHAGEVGNVIPDTATLEISIRSVDETDWEQVSQRIEALVNGICQAHGAHAQFEWQIPYPMVVNADVAVNRAWHAATRAINESKVFEAEPWSPSDDFSYFSREVPRLLYVPWHWWPGSRKSLLPAQLQVHSGRACHDLRDAHRDSNCTRRPGPSAPPPPQMPATEQKMPAAGALAQRSRKPGLGTPQSRAGQGRSGNAFPGAVAGGSGAADAETPQAAPQHPPAFAPAPNASAPDTSAPNASAPNTSEGSKE